MASESSKPPHAEAKSGPQSEGGAAWRRRHLLALGDLDAAEIRALLHESKRFLPDQGDRSGQEDDLLGAAVATLFFEDSTRTRGSFTLAARRLGAHVVDLSGGSTSVSKGETLIDTARTVEAFGVDAIVVRAAQSGAARLIADHVACSVINAGDGAHEHPTQGLLDALALAEALELLDTFDFSGRNIAIVGDVNNSRVARSALAAFTRLGAHVGLVGPPAMVSRDFESLGATIHRDFDDILPKADAVMMLRIQFERGSSAGSLDQQKALWRLTSQRVDRMKSGAFVMHPGPMNRDIEIDPRVADGERSLALRQVRAGVAVRSAVLGSCIRAARASRD